jgi:hypothetical protein
MRLKTFKGEFTGPVMGGVAFIRAENEEKARELLADQISKDPGINRRDDYLARAVDSIEITPISSGPISYAQIWMNGDY